MLYKYVQCKLQHYTTSLILITMCVCVCACHSLSQSGPAGTARQGGSLLVVCAFLVCDGGDCVLCVLCGDGGGGGVCACVCVCVCVCVCILLNHTPESKDLCNFSLRC